MTPPIVQRLRDAAAALPDERVAELELSMAGLALFAAAGLMLMAWMWGSEWLLTRVSI